jgi:hypothetical protein
MHILGFLILYLTFNKFINKHISNNHLLFIYFQLTNQQQGYQILRYQNDSTHSELSNASHCLPSLL